MEQYAHIAECSIGANHSFVITAPDGDALDNLFTDLLSTSIRVDVTVARFERRTLFTQRLGRTVILEKMTTHFGYNVCPICIKLYQPCWHWRSLDLSKWPEDTLLLKIAQATPVSQEAVEAALRDARGGSNAVSQIQSASATVRSALAQPPAQVRPRRSRLEAILDDITDTPTPPPTRPTPARVEPARGPIVGHTRCTTCGQVIPPGFEMKKDANKTENEIYEECNHEFDEKTNICKKCNLKKRAGRFSLLEVD